MNLHAKNVALQAGIPTDLVNSAVDFMKARNQINQKTAIQYLKSHDLFKTGQAEALVENHKLSSFYVELHESFLPEPLILTILMESNGVSYHLSIEKEVPAQNKIV